MSNAIQPVVSLRNVSKRFTYTPDQPRSVLETLIHTFNRRLGRASHQDLWAVKDLSFDVLPGQSLGLIGRNGSGKSTVLKLIARILRPTQGQVMVRGRVSALLELGAGFHPDLTGRENIFLNASVLGLQAADVRRHYDEIVEFSELGEFINMPVKHYSSGMYMRLGFSVAVHVNPNILIIDEILAVGDQAFRMKCVDRIHALKNQGVTIILISHEIETVRRLCSDLIWLEHGEVRAAGATESVASEYKHFSDERIGAQMAHQDGTQAFRRWGTREVEITAVRILNAAGNEQTIFRTGDAITLEMSYEAHRPVPEPEFGLAIFRQDGVHLNGPNSRLAGLETGVVSGRGVVRYRIDSLPLLPALYQVTMAIYSSRSPEAYDHHDRAYSFRVIGGGNTEIDGLLELPATWEWQPLGDAATDPILSAADA